MKSDRKRWNERFKGKRFAFGKKANSFLRKHVALLPRGKALDLAAGEGRNAVFLAQHGFRVDAVDISETGLLRVSELNRHLLQNLPFPLFAKEGNFTSLWQREERRDFTKQCRHYYETVNKKNSRISPKERRKSSHHSC